MKKQIAINSFTNVSVHFVRMVIALFMTPFLLSRLGKEVYGILPLVNSLVAFLVLASGGIQGAVGRYATFYLSKENNETANRFINTAFFLLAGIMGLMLLPFLVCVFFLPVLLNLPAGHEFEAQLVFFILGINLLIGILFSPLTIGLYFKQRFDVKNGITVIGQLFYLALVIAAFHFFRPNIVYVSLSMLVNTVVTNVFFIWTSVKLVPSIRISFTLFDREKLKEIAGFSFWVIIIQATTLIFLNTDYIIINKFLGSASVTNYSLPARFNEMLRNIITAAITVVTPLCTQLEAKGAFDTIRMIFERGQRIVLFIVIPASFLLCIFSRELLVTWVGSEFAHLSMLFWVVLLPQILILAAMPCNVILGGMGKVKVVGIVNSISAVLNIGLSILFVWGLNYGIMGVALATSLVLSLKNFLFLPVYTSHVIKAPYMNYYNAFFRPLMAAVPMVALAFYLHSSFDIIGWFELLYTSGICTAVFCIAAYVLAFDDSDKEDLKTFLHRSLFYSTARR